MRVMAGYGGLWRVMAGYDGDCLIYESAVNPHSLRFAGQVLRRVCRGGLFLWGEAPFGL